MRTPEILSPEKTITRRRFFVASAAVVANPVIHHFIPEYIPPPMQTPDQRLLTAASYRITGDGKAMKVMGDDNGTVRGVLVVANGHGEATCLDISSSPSLQLVRIVSWTQKEAQTAIYQLVGSTFTVSTGKQQIDTSLVQSLNQSGSEGVDFTGADLSDQDKIQLADTIGTSPVVDLQETKNAAYWDTHVLPLGLREIKDSQTQITAIAQLQSTFTYLNEALVHAQGQ